MSIAAKTRFIARLAASRQSYRFIIGDWHVARGLLRKMSPQACIAAPHSLSPLWCSMHHRSFAVVASGFSRYQITRDSCAAGIARSRNAGARTIIARLKVKAPSTAGPDRGIGTASLYHHATARDGARQRSHDATTGTEVPSHHATAHHDATAGRDPIAARPLKSLVPQI